jgi:hypothetical protein
MGRIPLALLLITFCWDAANACSPPPTPMLYFGYGTAELKESDVRAVRNGLLLPASVEPKCVLFEISVTSDPSEGGEQVGSKRLAAAKRLLIDAGFSSSNLKGQQSVTRMAQPRDSFGIRRAELKWTWARGKMRCDPTTKQQPFPPACQGDYAACYLELEDGTVCNINNVPDPNPTRYSAVLGNQ